MSDCDHASIMRKQALANWGLLGHGQKNRRFHDILLITFYSKCAFSMYSVERVFYNYVCGPGRCLCLLLRNRASRKNCSPLVYIPSSENEMIKIYYILRVFFLLDLFLPNFHFPSARVTNMLCIFLLPDHRTCFIHYNVFSLNILTKTCLMKVQIMKIFSSGNQSSCISFHFFSPTPKYPP